MTDPRYAGGMTRNQPNLEEVEGREHGPRHLTGLPAKAVTGLAFSWSVFQLLVAGIWPLSSDIVAPCTSRLPCH